MLILDTEASASLLLSSLQVLAGAKIWTLQVELLKGLRKVQAPQRSVRQVSPKSVPTILALWWSGYTMSLAKTVLRYQVARKRWHEQVDQTVVLASFS